MLLDNNTKKVFDLIDMYDNLNNVDIGDLSLTEAQVDDIVAFLMTLTDL